MAFFYTAYDDDKGLGDLWVDYGPKAGDEDDEDEEDECFEDVEEEDWDSLDNDGSWLDFEELDEDEEE